MISNPTAIEPMPARQGTIRLTVVTPVFNEADNLDRYAAEMAFRDDNCRTPNGALFKLVLGLICTTGPSRDFVGYWQRSWAA